MQSVLKHWIQETIDTEQRLSMKIGGKFKIFVRFNGLNLLEQLEFYNKFHILQLK